MIKKLKISLMAILVSSMFISANIFAMELDFNWDVGEAFFNGQMDIKKSIEGRLNAGARAGEFIFSDNHSSLALHVNAFAWDCENIFNSDKVTNRFSFLNLELFYDILHFTKSNMNIGPYASINYLDLINMKFTSYQVDVGFKYTYYSNEKSIYCFKPEAVTLRSGIRIKDNIPGIYFEGSFNLAGFIIGCINTSYNNALQLKNNENL